ncbi:MAG: FtsQ-type POTRA domain-containing protein, partial [Acidimicrobiia bacterium]|nr:FtsQ-type POTRA domain-containing protein [Acidimicrobiia bacterium]
MDPRLAERRKEVAETRVRTGIRRLLLIAALLGVVLAGLAVLRSPIFSLERIDVSGARQTDPVAMLASADIVVGTPLIELDLELAEETLLADPRIATVSLERRWPRGLRVTVSERFAVAWVDQGSGWRQVAIDGVVLGSGEPGATATRIRSVPG